VRSKEYPKTPIDQLKTRRLIGTGRGLTYIQSAGEKQPLLPDKKEGQNRSGPGQSEGSTEDEGLAYMGILACCTGTPGRKREPEGLESGKGVKRGKTVGAGSVTTYKWVKPIRSWYNKARKPTLILSNAKMEGAGKREEQNLAANKRGPRVRVPLR